VEAAREFDIVVYGATGFVGKLTAEYLAKAAPEGAKIALAGRSQQKLDKVKAELGVAWPTVVADSSDRAAVKSMAERAKVIATTVGPYRRYGMELAAACAEAGTHYADLTGEPLFIRDVIDRYHETAKASGARIVHCCGFDSIPSDLGVLALHQEVGELGETTYVVRSMKGGASGGTIDSMRVMIDEVKAEPAKRKLMNDPYALSPDRSAEPQLGDESDPRGPMHDDGLDAWLAPFVMGAINTRIVRRSNALQGFAYGKTLKYRETMYMGSGIGGRVKAMGVSGGLGAMMVGMGVKPTRMVLDKVLPDPGEGPSPEAREKGFFKIDIHTRTPAGERYVCRVAADGDPGYKATAVMLGEAALCLALDGDKLPDAAGVLTPATAMGAPLIERLRAAGHTYEVTKT
jgi:short subunit dehydrogenase-like uncharacterized protein